MAALAFASLKYTASNSQLRGVGGGASEAVNSIAMLFELEHADRTSQMAPMETIR